MSKSDPPTPAELAFIRMWTGRTDAAMQAKQRWVSAVLTKWKKEHPKPADPFADKFRPQKKR